MIGTPGLWHLGHKRVKPGLRAETSSGSAPSSPGGSRWAFVGLDDQEAVDTRLVGGKAASLARAHSAGLPVLPGVVLTTTACARLRAGGREQLTRELDGVWELVSLGGVRPVVVRSSGVEEDGQGSSMAGVFRSVVGVSTHDAFLDAVDEVVASATAGDGGAAAMAVLVQPHLDCVVGGVLFGADPVSGRTDRLMVVAAAGGPEALVQGALAGAQVTLSRWGRRLGPAMADASAGAELLPSRLCRSLARLSARAASIFGSPQDVEWAVDAAGKLWLLQSRPVTALPARAAGPLLGPGPVAETFPEPLTALEEDLWLPPLREAIVFTLSLTGARSRRRLRRSPVVTAVDGRVAADLGLLGAVRERSALGSLDPRPGLRRLRAAWGAGRLRAALPALARDVVARADDELGSVPRLAALETGELVALLRRCQRALVGLHAHEMLVGLLLRPGAGATTAAAVALHSLAAARGMGVKEELIPALHPEVLALVPPAVGPVVSLPPVSSTPAIQQSHRAGDEAALVREDLRVRVRWVQELSARAAWELGVRLSAQGCLEHPSFVRWLTQAELEAVAGGAGAPGGLSARAGARLAPPLPFMFRLSGEGRVVPEDAPPGLGTGAGGGRGMGRAAFPGRGDLPPGSVLVVRSLDPSLAPLLAGLGGLVAETGSPLSHLAILAREMGVPTVVGVSGACEKIRPGALLVVDGTTGQVEQVAEPYEGEGSDVSRAMDRGELA